MWRCSYQTASVFSIRRKRGFLKRTKEIFDAKEENYTLGNRSEFKRNDIGQHQVA